MVEIGQVWRHATYYMDRETGEQLAKFLLVLGFSKSNDIIYKLLTSRIDHRPILPVCFHGDPRPGFYMGIPQTVGTLSKETWLDLRESEDFDHYDFRTLAGQGILTQACELPKSQLCELLECAANAPDTLRSQRDGMMNSRAELNCF
jgi:hypothetical protein